MIIKPLRLTALLLALALLPIHAALAEENDLSMSFGSDKDFSRFVNIDGLNAETLLLNGIPYHPQLLKGKAIIRVLTGDLLAANAVNQSPEILTNVKLDPNDVFIRNGSIFINEAARSKATATGETKDTLPKILQWNGVDMAVLHNPFSLAGDAFTISDGSSGSLHMGVSHIWQSPQPYPEYVPNSHASIPLPPYSSEDSADNTDVTHD